MKMEKKVENDLRKNFKGNCISLENEPSSSERSFKGTTDANLFEGDIERDDKENMTCFNESFSDVTEDRYFDCFKNWS